MAYIEEAMERLTLSQAKQMTLQGAETPLCFSSGPPESRHVYILNSIGYVSLSLNHWWVVLRGVLTQF